MNSDTPDSSSHPPAKDYSMDQSSAKPAISSQDSDENQAQSDFSASGISSWARSLKFPQQLGAAEKDSKIENGKVSGLARFTNAIGLKMPSVVPIQDDGVASTTAPAQSGVLESFTTSLVDSSRSAVKAISVKARHIVSQNKRRYQEGGFDLDMTYITENIIAMGFPAGDLSSGIFGFLEGFYRNHMEEVIKFFETHHKGKYKVYNLCSERLYDASLFEGKVASFPFDDHNCPPIHLIKSFCQSAYSWLKDDIENVVVVHCKAGIARTGLMICSLLLYLKFFPTSEEAIDYYNKKRCVDGKALVLPSQIRYVNYFDRILTYFHGDLQPGRRCMLRGFRLHKCPSWIRPSITISNHNGILFSTRKHPKTKNLMPEDFWIRAAKKGFVVFALPGQPGLTELVGDFKIHFHDRHGDFYCWLNTTMIQNRMILSGSELDGFDKRNLPSPGFQVEIVMIDYDGTVPAKSKADSSNNPSPSRNSVQGPVTNTGTGNQSGQAQLSKNEEDNDDVFSDSDGEETGAKKNQPGKPSSSTSASYKDHVLKSRGEIEDLAKGTNQLSIKTEGSNEANNASKEHNTSSGLDAPKTGLAGANYIKAIAADASVFSFGDEEDSDSE